VIHRRRFSGAFVFLVFLRAIGCFVRSGKPWPVRVAATMQRYVEATFNTGE